jgi:hypothetical protein
MVGTNARWSIAFVEHMESIRNRPEVQLPRNAMRHEGTTLKAALANRSIFAAVFASAAFRPGPNPTRFSLDYSFPEALFERATAINVRLSDVARTTAESCFSGFGDSFAKRELLFAPFARQSNDGSSFCATLKNIVTDAATERR